MNFRNDIQGIRAIAVLAVVVFHFNESWLPGGFIGVDVFFVISGYLMTSIIWTGLDNQRFNLLSFYASRFIRIVPALLVLCVIVSTFSFFFLNLVDFQNVINHSISSITFVSNIVYWSESGYFDAASKEKWLLHTWSLSVEWQFYLLFPIFMLLAKKVLRNAQLVFLLYLLTILTLIFSVFMTHKAPSASYFMLPTRAWEMLAGSLVFFFQYKPKQQLARLLEAVGIILVCVSAVFITKNDAWPGILTIAPVLGTCFILVANRQNSIFTSNVISQKLGALSYSIYLWHWPFVVAINYFVLPDAYIALGMVLSYGFGSLSYHLVERRFGKKKHTGKLSFTLKPTIIMFACVCLTFGSFLLTKNSRFFENSVIVEPFISGQRYFEEGKLKDATGNAEYHFNGANEKNADIVAIGDSNVAHYIYGITQRGAPSVALSWSGSCLSFEKYITKPTESYMHEKWKKYCKSNYQKLNSYPDSNVIIAQDWLPREMLCVSSDCFVSGSKDNYYLILERELTSLLKSIRQGRNVLLIGQIPSPLEPMYKCFKGVAPDKCLTETSDILEEKIVVNRLLDNIANSFENVTFIDPFKVTCSEKGVCKVSKDGSSLFYDSGHLSAYGSIVFWDHIVEHFVK